GSDLLHINAVAYNAELDQIVLSTPKFNEIWIIDHSTTTQQAAGHSGGRWKKGGDVLYRWGNPRAYSRGAQEQQTLFGQHGRPGTRRSEPRGTKGREHCLGVRGAILRAGAPTGWDAAAAGGHEHLRCLSCGQDPAATPGACRTRSAPDRSPASTCRYDNCQRV